MRERGAIAACALRASLVVLAQAGPASGVAAATAGGGPFGSAQDAIRYFKAAFSKRPPDAAEVGLPGEHQETPAWAKEAEKKAQSWKNKVTSADTRMKGCDNKAKSAPVDAAARFSQEARRQLTASREALGKARADINATLARWQELQGALGTAKDRAQQAKEAVDLDGAKARRLRESIASLQSSLDHEAQSASVLRAELSERQAQNAESQGRVKALAADVDRRERQIQEMQESFWGQIPFLGSGAAADGEQELSAARADLASSNEKVRDEDAKLKTSAEGLQDRSRRLEEGRSLVAAARAQLEEATARLSADQCALARELAEVESVQSELDEQSVAARQASASLAAAEAAMRSAVEGVLHGQERVIGGLRGAVTSGDKDRAELRGALAASLKSRAEHSARASRAEAEGARKDAEIGGLKEKTVESAKGIRKAAERAKELADENAKKAAIIDKQRRALEGQARELKRTQDSLKMSEANAALGEKKVAEQAKSMEGMKKEIQSQGRKLAEEQAKRAAQTQQIEGHLAELGRRETEVTAAMRALERQNATLAAQDKRLAEQAEVLKDVVGRASQRDAELGAQRVGIAGELCRRKWALERQDAIDEKEEARRRMLRAVCEQDQKMERITQALRGAEQELARLRYWPPPPRTMDPVVSKLSDFTAAIAKARN